MRGRGGGGLVCPHAFTPTTWPCASMPRLLFAFYCSLVATGCEGHGAQPWHGAVQCGSAGGSAVAAIVEEGTCASALLSGSVGTFYLNCLIVARVLAGCHTCHTLLQRAAVLKLNLPLPSGLFIRARFTLQGRSICHCRRSRSLVTLHTPRTSAAAGGQSNHPRWLWESVSLCVCVFFDGLFDQLEPFGPLVASLSVPSFFAPCGLPAGIRRACWFLCARAFHLVPLQSFNSSPTHCAVALCAGRHSTAWAQLVPVMHACGMWHVGCHAAALCRRLGP